MSQAEVFRALAELAEETDNVNGAQRYYRAALAVDPTAGTQQRLDAPERRLRTRKSTAAGGPPQ